MTLVVLNTEEHAVEISAADIGTGESLGDAEAYILTSYPDVLTSRDAFLNGKCSSSLCVFSGASPEALLATQARCSSWPTR